MITRKSHLCEARNQYWNAKKQKITENIYRKSHVCEARNQYWNAKKQKINENIYIAYDLRPSGKLKHRLWMDDTMDGRHRTYFFTWTSILSLRNPVSNEWLT
jgi:hypothetical protein